MCELPLLSSSYPQKHESGALRQPGPAEGKGTVQGQSAGFDAVEGAVTLLTRWGIDRNGSEKGRALSREFRSQP